MTTFVLIHGAFHGAWCWEKTTPLLEAAGHQVVTPALPGHGNNPCPRAEMGQERYGDEMTEIIKDLDGPVTLVGHSMAGMVITGVAERIPEKLERLVYLTAYLPLSGDCIRDLVKFKPAPNRRWKTEDTDGTPLVVVGDEEVGTVFYNDADDATVQWAKAQLIPEPAAAFTDRVTFSEARYGAVPRDYITCRKDAAILPELQDIMMERAGVRRTVTLETGHSPFATDPDALVQALLTLHPATGA